MEYPNLGKRCRDGSLQTGAEIVPKDILLLAYFWELRLRNSNLNKTQRATPSQKILLLYQSNRMFLWIFLSYTSTPAETLSLARQHLMSPQVMEARLSGLKSRWFCTILERTRFCSIGFRLAPTRRRGWVVSVYACESRDAGSILSCVAFFFLSFYEASSLKYASEHLRQTSSRWPSG